jgi:hypothetical protein
MGLMHLKLHYKVDLLLELDNFKDVVENCLKNVHFLNNKSGRTFVVFFYYEFIKRGSKHLFFHKLQECPSKLVVHESHLQNDCLYL